MTPQQYAAAQAALSAAIAVYAAKFSAFFVRPVLTVAEWLGLLQILWPEVERSRYEAASIARTFYDSERRKHYPQAPIHEVFLETSDFPSFVKSMEPARKRMSQMDSPKDAVTSMVLHVVRDVENAGRQQIIHAIEEDDLELEAVIETPVSVVEEIRLRVESQVSEFVPDDTDNLKKAVAETAGKPKKKSKSKQSGPVRGWARVATGDETCAWCLMLISRGPVYKSAKSAGLDLHDAGALDALENDTDVSEWMKEWHIGCDCKVVPVFDQFDWPGMEAREAALNLWIEASKAADETLAANPNKKSYVKGRWVPTTVNRQTINELRRRLDRGEISPSEYAALAA